MHGWNDFKDAHNALANYDKQIDHMLEWTQGNKQKLCDPWSKHPTWKLFRSMQDQSPLKVNKI